MKKLRRARNGWTVVIAGLAINLILGVLYAWGVIAKALGSDWHWTKTQATLPFTVATVCFAGMMVFAGRCQDKFGPRLVATTGGIMLGLGLVASALVHSPIAMALTFGVGAGLGIGLGYSATTPPAIKWFPPARKGVITGIVVSGVGLAAVYISPLTQYLLGRTTISMTFVWLGVGHAGSGAAAGAAFAKPAGTAGGAGVGHANGRGAPGANRIGRKCCAPGSSTNFGC